jgi:hypothetical protein
MTSALSSTHGPSPRRSCRPPRHPPSPAHPRSAPRELVAGDGGLHPRAAPLRAPLPLATASLAAQGAGLAGAGAAAEGGRLRALPHRRRRRGLAHAGWRRRGPGAALSARRRIPARLDRVAPPRRLPLRRTGGDARAAHRLPPRAGAPVPRRHGGRGGDLALAAGPGLRSRTHGHRRRVRRRRPDHGDAPLAPGTRAADARRRGGALALGRSHDERQHPPVQRPLRLRARARAPRLRAQVRRRDQPGRTRG